MLIAKPGTNRGSSSGSSGGGGGGAAPPHVIATPAPLKRTATRPRRGTAARSSTSDVVRATAGSTVQAPSAPPPQVAPQAAAAQHLLQAEDGPRTPPGAPLPVPAVLAPNVTSHALQEITSASSSASSSCPASDAEAPGADEQAGSTHAPSGAARLVRAFKTPRGRAVHVASSSAAGAAPRQHPVRVPSATRPPGEGERPSTSGRQHLEDPNRPQAPRRRQAPASVPAAPTSTAPSPSPTATRELPSGPRQAAPAAAARARRRPSWRKWGQAAAVLLASVVVPLLAQRCAQWLRAASIGTTATTTTTSGLLPALALGHSHAAPGGHALSSDLTPQAPGASQVPLAGRRSAAAGSQPHAHVSAAASSSPLSLASRLSQRVAQAWRAGAPAPPPLHTWGWLGRGGGGVGTGGGHRGSVRARSSSTADAGVGGIGGGGSGSGTPATFPRTGGLTRQWEAGADVRVLAVVPAGVASPYRDAPWDEVLAHVGRRLAWTNPAFQLLLFSEQELLHSQDTWKEFVSLMEQKCQILLGGALSSPALAAKLRAAADEGWTPALRVFLPGAGAEAASQGALDFLALTSLKGHTPQAPSPVDQALGKLLPWSGAAKAAEVWATLQDLWSRHTSDDALFVILVLVNSWITDVPQVSMTTKGFDLPSLQCMLMHCRGEVLACVRDPTCKTALDCLQACKFNDQTCAYRCIVSYETPKLTDFSLCILEKHNCRSLSMGLPALPDPRPMGSFRGAPLTHEVAEGMLLGWLDSTGAPLVPGGAGGEALKPFSWLVAAGKNPAYDYFPCQHQLFFRGKAKGSLWYAPVFKVITVDGRTVWRERRYRVKRGQAPGSFHLSVLDNGVVSQEFWRVLDCAEDLSWVLLYYSGAASAAGLQYSGAVLGTRTGAMPSAPATLQRLEAALDLAGIKPWELSLVNNNDCAGAPLEGVARA